MSWTENTLSADSANNTEAIEMYYHKPKNWMMFVSGLFIDHITKAVAKCEFNFVHPTVLSVR